MNSSRRTEITVGIFLLSGIAILAILIATFGRFNERFKDYYNIGIIFNDASGLVKGAEVRMGGAKIGRVNDTPTLNSELKVLVNLSVRNDIQIPVNSQIQVASASVLGDKLIIITPPEHPSGKVLQPNAVLEGGGLSGLDAIQNDAEAMARDARRLMKNTEGTIHKIDASVDDLHLAVKQLNDTLSRVNTKVLNDDNLSHFQNTLSNLDAASTSWKSASAELKPTLDQAKKTMASLEKTSLAAQTSIREIQPTLVAFRQTATKTNLILDRFHKGKGILSTLIDDKDSAFDLKAFLRNLRERGLLRYKDMTQESQTFPEGDPRNYFRGSRH